MTLPLHPADCAGCLGNGKCWVCMGTGYLGPDTGATCHRCGGTRYCTEGEVRPIVAVRHRRRRRAAS